MIEEAEIPILILPKTAETENAPLRLVGLAKNMDSLAYMSDLTVFQLAKPDRKMLLHFGEHILNRPKIETIPTQSGKTTDETFIAYIKKHQKKNLYIINHQKRHGLMDFFKRSFTQNLLVSGDMNLIVI